MQFVLPSQTEGYCAGIRFLIPACAKGGDRKSCLGREKPFSIFKNSISDSKSLVPYWISFYSFKIYFYLQMLHTLRCLGIYLPRCWVILGITTDFSPSYELSFLPTPPPHLSGSCVPAHKCPEAWGELGAWRSLES